MHSMNRRRIEELLDRIAEHDRRKLAAAGHLDHDADDRETDPVDDHTDD